MQKILSKKKNQRKLYAIVALSLITLLAFTSVQAGNRATEAREEAEALNQQRIDIIEELETLSEELESIEMEKADTEAQLEEKALREAEKQREIERLERELQAKREREAEQRRIAEEQRQRQARLTATRTVSAQAGNTYSYGYCTWYVKNRRPDIPNGLGNANMWLHNARAMGLPTGSEPRAGAVAQTSAGPLGHVAIVESVNGDGTVTISEMNYRGWNVVNQRTVAASNFNYIY